MRIPSQKSESFDRLLQCWLDRAGLRALTVRDRIEAGARLHLSHQTIADYLAGRLPHPNRIPALAAAMGVSERKLRQVIERQRHANDGATAADESTVAEGAK